MYTLYEFKKLITDNKFHHATYKELGGMFEGLYIYENSQNGFRGFDLVGTIYKDSNEYIEAGFLVKDASVGSYGQG